MDKVIGVFKGVIKNAVPVSGRILKSPENALVVSSKWSQRNVERKMPIGSELIQIVNVETSDVTTLTSVETTTEWITAYSPSSKYRGIFRDIPASGKTPKKQHLEIWAANRMVRNCDVSIFELHGDVYSDSEFGCFEWSSCEKKILYVAEKKKPKTEPFLPVPSKKNDEIQYGSEYLFTEEWGESLVGKSSPILATFNLEKSEVTLIKGVPPDLSLGQGIWTPEGDVVCVAWENEPRRLGLVYCTNRKSWICHITRDGQFNKLSQNGCAVRSPKFSPNGESLVWLERDAGGPHHGCHRLIKYDWINKKKKTVVNIIDDCVETENHLKFYGLYCLDLGNCWLSDNKTIIVSTPQLTSVRTFSIETDTHIIVDITGCEDESYSLGVFDVKDNFVLGWKSSVSETPSLLMGRLCNETFTWTTLIESEVVTEGFETQIVKFETTHEPSEVKNFTAIYYGPKDADKVPLVVCPHGGPHSAYTNSYSMVANFFAQLGFGVLLVNYRGSIGAGQNTIDFLLGKVGTADVNDVHQAVQEIVSKNPSINPDNIALFGGSHGGFLVLHLAGQFPTKYCSVVALNPVTDLSNPSGSDIPDWAYTEGGQNYDSLIEMDGEMFDSLRKKSPIFHVDKVKTPVLLLIGKKDLRVHPTQGYTYYQALKARCEKTKMLCYDDNHSLSQTPHELDFCINSALWFLEHIDN